MAYTSENASLVRVDGEKYRCPTRCTSFLISFHMVRSRIWVPQYVVQIQRKQVGIGGLFLT